MALAPALLEILACPEDKGPLLYIESESLLYNPRLHRRYDIRDDIPVMLIPESTEVDTAEHDRLMQVVAESGIEPTFAADIADVDSAPADTSPVDTSPVDDDAGGGPVRS